MSNTPELIRAIGEALYGTRWITDMSEELEVNRRTIARWLTRDYEPQPGVWSELEALMVKRIGRQKQLCAALRARQ